MSQTPSSCCFIFSRMVLKAMAALREQHSHGEHSEPELPSLCSRDVWEQLPHRTAWFGGSAVLMGQRAPLQRQIFALCHPFCCLDFSFLLCNHLRFHAAPQQ